MKPEEDGWYSYTIYGYTDAYVLFNNNAGQQIPAEGQEGFYVNKDMWYANGKWQDTKPKGKTVYFYNSDNWSTPYIYCYGTEGENAKWPGVPMTRDQDGWYKYTIYHHNEAYVLFNNNAGQQIPAQGQEGLYVNKDMWYANGKWQDSKPEGKTVYFYNSNNWSTPYIYCYGTEGENAKWPGVPMTRDQNGWYKYTIYHRNEAYVLFNNNAGWQIPGSGQAGFLLNQKDMWYKNGNWLSYKP